jgi:hypothetical protein
MKFIVSTHVSNINYFNETTSGTLAVAGDSLINFELLNLLVL